jgi:hypothetical protein
VIFSSASGKQTVIKALPITVSGAFCFQMENNSGDVTSEFLEMEE